MELALAGAVEELALTGAVEELALVGAVEELALAGALGLNQRQLAGLSQRPAGLDEIWLWVLSGGPDCFGKLKTEGGRQILMQTGQMLWLGLQP